MNLTMLAAYVLYIFKKTNIEQPTIKTYNWYHCHDKYNNIKRSANSKLRFLLIPLFDYQMKIINRAIKNNIQITDEHYMKLIQNNNMELLSNIDFEKLHPIIKRPSDKMCNELLQYVLSLENNEKLILKMLKLDGIQYDNLDVYFDKLVRYNNFEIFDLLVKKYHLKMNNNIIESCGNSNPIFGFLLNKQHQEEIEFVEFY